MPRKVSKDDKDAIPSGSFGKIAVEDHNKYECYVSPYVTSQLVIKIREAHRGAWNPFPRGAFPDGGLPNQNLLEYKEPERLNRTVFQISFF